MKVPGGHEREGKYMSPDLISVDNTYQRDLDINRVNRTAKAWNGDLFNAPKLSYRDGKYFVFDGQHSAAIWQTCFGNKPMPVVIYKGLTWEEEVNLFIAQNGISKDPTTNDKLKALYNSRNEDVVGMVESAAEGGLVVDFKKSPKPFCVVAVAALFKAYKALPRQAFIAMCSCIASTWDGDRDSTTQMIINGMKQIYRYYYGEFRQSEMIASLQKVSPTSIIREGKDLPGTMENKYGTVILKHYNKKRSSRRLEKAW